MNMKKCLDSVIRYQRRKEDEYVTRAIMPCTQRNIIYGEEMNQFLGMTSEWLADVFLNTFEVRQVQLRSTRLRVEEAIFECAVIPYRLPETIVKEALAMIDRTDLWRNDGSYLVGGE
ncbi:hypothetical protein PC110_g4944 [Phytophthora cactorum]|uniref:Uncharacterized protein n=1 Tax=Phytophthora cactorum TaxID=29920 RepID=A0A329SS99_9STRA|nr:hypothetical protein PC110_g4944 [Phytophthora cactorum]